MPLAHKKHDETKGDLLAQDSAPTWTLKGHQQSRHAIHKGTDWHECESELTHTLQPIPLDKANFVIVDANRKQD
tara:strand:+ start:245 stop:466 length:222 start_codon:yes stop_codon:yes gene_type:complete